MANVNEAIIEIGAGEVDDSVAEEVYRNLKILYGTTAGEQALDRDFGIDLEVADNPSEESEALLTAEYVRKTQQYEPRARVSAVNWTQDTTKNGNLTPKVVIELV